jgi:HEAT repeat protein
VRKAAIDALSSLDDDPAAVAPLLEALDDGDGDVREAASFALASVKAPAALDEIVRNSGRHLCRALLETSASAPGPAVSRLVEMRDPAMLAELSAGLVCASSPRRHHCAMATLLLGDEAVARTIRDLTPALHDRSWRIAGAAFETIVDLASPAAEPQLRQLLKDDDSIVRGFALTALGRCGTDALAHAAEDPDPAIAGRAREALGQGKPATATAASPAP